MTMSCLTLVVAFKTKRSAAADVLFAGPWMWTLIRDPFKFVRVSEMLRTLPDNKAVPSP